MTDKAALYRELQPLLDGPSAPDRDGRIWSYCPAHGDGTKHKRHGQGMAGRSLSLSPATGLTCFAGCTFEAIKAALYARAGRPDPATLPGGLAANRSGDELAAKRAQGRSGGALGPEWTLIEEYEYRDESGALMAIKGRFHKPDAESEKGYEKSFRWRLPEGEYRNGIKSRFEGMPAMPLWGSELLA